MTIPEITNIDNIDELHKLVIHHEVEIEKLKNQISSLQFDNKSLQGFYNRQKEFNKDHVFINRSDYVEWLKCYTKLQCNSKDEVELDKAIADCSLFDKINNIKKEILDYHG